MTPAGRAGRIGRPVHKEPIAVPAPAPRPARPVEPAAPVPAEPVREPSPT
jgi:hypothetical protein